MSTNEDALIWHLGLNVSSGYVQVVRPRGNQEGGTKRGAWEDGETIEVNDSCKEDVMEHVNMADME